MSVKDKLDSIFENLRRDIVGLLGKGSTDTNTLHAKVDEAKSAALKVSSTGGLPTGIISPTEADPTSEASQAAPVAAEAPTAKPGAEGRDTPVQPEHPANTTDNRF